MCQGGKNLRVVAWLVAGVIASTMAGGCAGIPVNVPGFGFLPDTVLIELVNITEFPIDPGLFVDPDENELSDAELINEENLEIIDPPVQPDEIVTLEFDCEEVGTVFVDALLFLSDSEAVASDNAPLVLGGIDFFCGDILTFIFTDEQGGTFVTLVTVNDEFLTD